jgi:Neuraminidase (sialidase)
MRASEFITESKKRAKVTKRQAQSSVGLDVFRDVEFADRFYELNRVMMAVAASDGINPVKIDQESWIGRLNLAAPYSSIEQKMLSDAFKAVGAYHEDLVQGDLRSQELSDVNKTSPVTGFKGFKK